MWNYYPKAAPRPKAVPGKERMKFGTTWWGKKWVEAVEEVGDEQRMSRGRAYARANRAFDIDVKDGRVAAKVEGSRGNYKVSMRFNKIGGDEKIKLLSTLLAQPELLGAILNNELPENIEKETNINLIPDDFDSECSCPDYENPCKHIAAVFYALAAEIDAAPQILLKIRGVDKTDILNAAARTADTAVNRPTEEKKIRKARNSSSRRTVKKKPAPTAASPCKTPRKKQKNKANTQ